MTSGYDPDAAQLRAIERLLQDKGLARAAGDGGQGQACASDQEKDAFLAATEVWDGLGCLKNDPDYAGLLGRPTWRERVVGLVMRQNADRRRRIDPVLAVSGAAMAVAVAALIWFGVEPEGTVYATTIGEVRELALADGSTIALGAKSRLEVAYTLNERHIEMQPGEAFFSVTPDPTRPFIIKAGDTRITVVGTKFNVKYDGAAVKITVAEGTVKVAPPKSILALKPKPALPVDAGQQAAIEPEAERVAVAPAAFLPAETWLKGQLAYEDAPLREIVADINRYLPGSITIASSRLAEERLTTSFRTEQAAAFLESLPQVLPVEIQGKIGQRVVLKDAAHDG